MDVRDTIIDTVRSALADLGVEDMILLSNSQPNVVAIEGYGLNIVDHMPIPE